MIQLIKPVLALATLSFFVATLTAAAESDDGTLEAHPHCPIVMSVLTRSAIPTLCVSLLIYCPSGQQPSSETINWHSFENSGDVQFHSQLDKRAKVVRFQFVVLSL